MATAWIEHVSGALWTAPLRGDDGDQTLSDKVDELGIVPKSDRVTALPGHRYIVCQQGDGRLVMLMATDDDQLGLFRSLPV